MNTTTNTPEIAEGDTVNYTWCYDGSGVELRATVELVTLDSLIKPVHGHTTKFSLVYFAPGIPGDGFRLDTYAGEEWDGPMHAYVRTSSLSSKARRDPRLASFNWLD